MAPAVNRARHARPLVALVLAIGFGLTGCGDADSGSDNTGQPTKGSLPEEGAPVSTPENMRE